MLQKTLLPLSKYMPRFFGQLKIFEKRKPFFQKKKKRTPELEASAFFPKTIMNRNHNGKNHHQQELMYSLARWFFSNFDPTSNPRNLQLDGRNPTIIRNFGPKKTHGKNSHYPKNIVSLGLSCVFPIEPNAIRRQFWKFESSEKSIWATKKTLTGCWRTG